MNQNSLNQIFQHYIDKFELVNNDEHKEYYKWQVCHRFPGLMQAALSAPDETFSRELYKVKKATFNIIDSYTQPLMGLVELAKEEPAAVRKILQDLYEPDGGDLKVQMAILEQFFAKCGELVDKYYPGSYLYKQNSHSASALLFLNDPDHHYMYKASHCWRFADCVEFYDDWGTGDNINLDIYYRMCDELVDAIKQSPAILDVDGSRFDGRLKMRPGDLHADTEKHILAFDIIYCCSTYKLFDGVTYTKRNLKEKKLFMIEKEKEEQAKREYEKAKAEFDLYNEAIARFLEMISTGDTIRHSTFGEGTIESIDEKWIVGDFSGIQKKFSLPMCLGNRIIRFDAAEVDESIMKYQDVLKRYDKIPAALDRAVRAIGEYEEDVD